MRKIALLAGAAGALMIAGPVLAQEATPPGRPPMPAQTAPTQMPPAEAQTQTPPAAQSGAVSLSPGQTVRGPDGELGKLEGVRVNAQGQQELTVRGADGQLRSVPLGGLQVNGGEVTVAWSLEQYQASPAIAAEPAPPPPADGSTPPAPPVPTLPAETQPSDPAAPPVTTDPMTPDTAAPPPTEPQA